MEIMIPTIPVLITLGYWVAFFILLWCLYIIAKKSIKPDFRWRQVAIPSVTVLVILFTSLVFSGSRSIRLAIEPLNNSALETYSQPKEVIIETPEARTKTLEGFKPLGN